MRRPIGYPPDKLHQVLLESKNADPSGKGKAKETDASWVPISSSEDSTGFPRVVYEIKANSDRLEPRLRLFVNSSKEKSSILPLQSITALENVSSQSLDSPPDLPPVPAEDTEEPTGSAPQAASTSTAAQSDVEVTEISTEGAEPVIHISCVFAAMPTLSRLRFLPHP